MEASDTALWLDKWIKNFINSDPSSSPKMRAQYPLREAKIEVKEIPGSPGAYHAVAHLRPWLQMEELTASLRLVAKIPEKK